MVLIFGVLIVLCGCVSDEITSQTNEVSLKKQYYIGYYLVKETDFNKKLNSLRKVKGSEQSKVIDGYNVTTHEMQDSSGKAYVYTIKKSKTHVMHFLLPKKIQ